MYPFSASSIEGINRSSIERVPNLSWILKIADIVPGTPTASPPKELNPEITLPSLSWYMFSEEPLGAVSLKSRVPSVPSSNLYTINPPPAIFPAVGWLTDKANWTPIIASNALPPFFIISKPISDASFLAETTVGE